ncbi:hypothetical protein [Novosphingobium colocasiae]|uniref:hypothetical protein n=1 Tax=Novosphingobium colocasiae TaxID=1256513 RepID=UPI0035B31A5E
MSDAAMDPASPPLTIIRLPPGNYRFVCSEFPEHVVLIGAGSEDEDGRASEPAE